jgi:hypothetical protein
MRRIIAALALGATALVGTAPAALAEDAPEPNPPVLERIGLRCRQGVVIVKIGDEAHRKLVIGCNWTQSQRRGFAGYKLVRRVDDLPREVIFRTDDREHTRTIDRRVRRDHEFTYRLVVVNADGAVIGLSNKVVVAT